MISTTMTSSKGVWIFCNKDFQYCTIVVHDVVLIQAQFDCRLCPSRMMNQVRGAENIPDSRIVIEEQR
jgi:hypothetical protein